MAQVKKNETAFSSFVAHLNATSPGAPNGQATAPTGQEIAQDVGAGGGGGEIGPGGGGPANVQSLLEQKPKSPTPEIAGKDNGRDQHIDLSNVPVVGPAVKKIEKKVVDAVVDDTEIHVVVINKSNMPLRLVAGSDQLEHTTLSEFKPSNGPPAEIPAAKDGTPGKADIVVKTKYGLIGKTPFTNLGGQMEYEVHGDPSHTHLLMIWHRGNISTDRKINKKITPSTGQFKLDAIPGNDDVFTFIVEGEGQDAKGKDTSDVSCRITIHNETKYDLKLSEAKNELGDFMTNPPDVVPAGKSPPAFVYVQTPHEKDPKKVGCKGYLVYDVGSPVVARWLCKWENPIGEKNDAHADLGTSVQGLRTTWHADQGDENVPFDFVLSTDEVAATKLDFSIGPFVVGKWDALDSGDLEKTIFDILHTKLPVATREAFKQGDAGGTKIVVSGYASNTGPEKYNLDLSLKRATKVIELFKKLGAPDSVFPKPIPYGEWESNPTDKKGQEKEDPNWRKVAIEVYVK
jgi:hypothetical protein